MVQSGLITLGEVPKGQDEADEIMNRVEGTTGINQAVKGTQFVIEAITENLKLKQEVFEVGNAGY